MLAYLSWHRAAAGVEQGAYEDALERFHRSLAHRPPSGFRGSAAFRLSELPWLAPLAGAEHAPAYEDWYVIDDWTAVGVLEEAAVAHGHVTAHDTVAGLAGRATGSAYRLVEGHARGFVGPPSDSARPPEDGLSATSGEPGSPAPGGDTAVWVTRAPGHEHPSLGALLGDGMDRERDGLWRRCLGLGPAPEYCLLAGGPTGPALSAEPAETREGVEPAKWPAGVTPGRLPAGWVAQSIGRAAVWDG